VYLQDVPGWDGVQRRARGFIECGGGAADGGRQTADRHSCCWGQLRSLSPETLGCCHAGRRCSRRSCGLSLARQLPPAAMRALTRRPCTTTHLHHEPASSLLGHTPTGTETKTKTETKTRTKTKTKTKAWPVPDSTARCIHPRSNPPTVRCLSRCFGPRLAPWHLTSPLPTTSSQRYPFLSPLPHFLPIAKSSSTYMHIDMAANTISCAPCSVPQNVTGGASNCQNQ
jgi:hypothetical protein